MSTNDVPGYKKEHQDELAMGCWAEHDDGSLILVEAMEGGRVVYCIFDMDPDPPVEYRDAMLEDDFKEKFSWPTDTGDKWTWHDKTPFPWDRIMDEFPAGNKASSAGAIMNAARRVAESLRLRAGGIADRGRRRKGSSARQVIDKLQETLDQLR